LIQRDETFGDGEFGKAGNGVDIEFLHDALAMSFDRAHPNA
jgi:hypothetical protein